MSRPRPPGLPRRVPLGRAVSAKPPRPTHLVCADCRALLSDVDHTMFVLNVDLWDVKGENEVNLVRSSQGSSSISVTTSLSYSTPSSGESSAASYTHPGLPPGRDQPYTPTQAMGYGSEYQGPQPGYALGEPFMHKPRAGVLPR